MIKLLTVICVSLFAPPPAQPDAPFTYSLYEINASIRIVSDKSGAPPHRENLAKHSLRFTFTITPTDLDNMYVFDAQEYRTYAEDKDGIPFLRSNLNRSRPSSDYSWINTPNHHPSVESANNRSRIKASHTCDSTPDVIGSLKVQSPIWRVVKYEHVEIDISDTAEWFTLPNGSRVKTKLITEGLSYPRLSVYRVHKRDDSGNITPPGFQIESIIDSDGTVLRANSFSDHRTHKSEDPSLNHKENIAEYIYSFGKRTKELPTKIGLNVIHEYELLEINFQLTDFPLGSATPHPSP